MSKIIAIANQKGGVGKTTTTMSLGAALARKGKKVLLVDLDQQGNLSSYLGFDGNGPTVAELLLTAAAGKSGRGTSEYIRHSEGESLDYIPSTILLADAEMQVISVIGRETILKRVLQDRLFCDYDYIIIDCPPALGIITINAFAAADEVIVPVELEKFAFDGMASLLNVLQLVQQTVNPDLRLGGIVQTKYDRSNMSAAISQALSQEYGPHVFETVISRAKEATNSSYRQQSLVSYKNKLGEQYLCLADELLEREAALWGD